MPHTTPPLKPTRLQIFKPGVHTAMSGQALQFSESDLQATVAAYDPAKHEAPLVVGHPQHDLPAYGWVQSLSFNEGGIDATPAQVNADFADMVAAGAFKKISASFYSPHAPSNPVPGVYYLRHVGFLGAQPPAVKGMRHPSFADVEEGVVEFSEWDDATNANIRDAAVEDASSATATPQFSDPQPKEPTVTPEEKAALEAENKALRDQLAAASAAQVHAAHVAFCEGVAGLPTEHRKTFAAVFDNLAAQPEVVQFGEGPDRAPLADQLKAALQALPPVVVFGELATSDKAAPTQSVDNPLLADAARRHAK